jgi:hypothetical protein
MWTAGITRDGVSGTVFAYSYDGIHWQASPTSYASSNQCNTIAWNGSIWVAGVSDSLQNQYLYSYDGINWNQSIYTTFSNEGQVNTVAYNGLMWVAGGSGPIPANGSELAYSYDGLRWTKSSTTYLNNGCNSVAWNGYMWVAGGNPDSSGNTIVYSYDGITWTDSSSGSGLLSTGCNTVSWNGSIWFAGGDSCPDYAIYSNDGINWSVFDPNRFTTPMTASAARRPLPYVGKTIVPPVLNQYVGPPNGAITYVSPSGGTGLNDIYYSRFVTIHESGPVGTGTLEVYGTVQIGRTASITYDASQDLVFNTTLLPDISDAYTIGNYGLPWKDLYVGTGGVHIGPTGIISGDHSGNLVVNTSFIPDVSDTYTLGNTGSTWKDVYIGTGGVHIGPTGILSGDHSGNLVLNTTLLPNTGYAYNLGSLEKPWTGVYVGTGSVHIGPTGTISADPSNLVFNTSLLPDLSDVYTLGRYEKPWKDVYVGTGGIFIGPTGSIFAYPSGNLAMGIVNGLFLTNGPNIGEVYDTYFNPPPSVTQSNLSTNNFMIAGDMSGSISYSYNGQAWTNGITTGLSRVYDVAWNGALWIATGTSDTNKPISYSSDGIHWNNDISGLFLDFQGRGIAWNGSMWIVTGINLFLFLGYYSYDGINWNVIPSTIFITPLLTSAGYKIAWNGYMWIATGGGSTYQIAYSYDGINWTGASSDIFINCYGIAWNGNLWVAVGSHGDNSYTIAYSTDGKEWTPVTGSSTANFDQGNSVAWNGSMWVAVGETSGVGRVATSVNGMIWNSIIATDPIRMVPMSVAWNGSVWTAVGSGASGLGPSNIEYSVDGIDWNSTSPLIQNRSFTSVASRRPLPFVGQTVVPPVFNQGTGPTGGALMYTSPTGTNDMYYSRFLSLTENGGTGILGVNGTIDIGPTGSISADGSGNLVLGIVNGLYLTNGSNNGTVYDTYFNPVNTNPSAFCVAGGTTTNRMAYSYDGLKWNGSASGNSLFSEACNAIAWNGTLWVAGGAGTNRLAYSSDGIHWTASTSGNTVFLSGSVFTVAWNGTIWVAGANGASLVSRMAYSHDGINWYPSTNSGLNQQCLSIAWNGYLWVAGGRGNNNQLATSLDGINWTPSSSGVFSPQQCYSVAWNGTMWVAGGFGTNKLAYSFDGLTWTGSASGNSLFTNSCRSVAWNGSLWVAGGLGSNSLIYSYDGQTWYSSGTTIIDDVNDITWNGTVWVAGGSGTYQMVNSYNGISWFPNTSGSTVFGGPEDVCEALASRRPLPFVGETVVPPVFNQGSGTGGALMYTSPTGTNDMYYSRFLSLSESTETLVVNGSVRLGPTGSISYDVSNLIINTNLLPDISNSYTLGSTGRPWAQLFVSPSGIHIGPTGSVVADQSGNLILNTNLLPDISNSYSLGSTSRPWSQLYVGPTGIQIGPTGSVVADQSGNLILNTNLLPSTGYAYNLGSFALPWQELYVGTGSVHIGPTGTISADQSGNLILGDLSGNGLKIIPNVNMGPMIKPVVQGLDVDAQLLFQAGLGTDYVYLNPVALGTQQSTLSLGQPNGGGVVAGGYYWNGLYLRGGTGIHFDTGPTIQADSSNVIVGSNLIPDISGIHNLGSATKPWADLYVDTNATIHVGPIGTITSDPSNNLVINTSLLPSTGNSYNLGSATLPWQELYVGTGSVHIGPTGTISANQSGNVIISTNSGLSLTGPLGPSQVYDSVYNPPPGGGGGASGEFLTENFMVAVGSGTSPIIYSYDGITWTNAIQSIFGTVNTVAWNGALWVCGGFNSGVGVIAYSSDGINWYEGIGNVLSNDVTGVAWNGSMWVAVGNSGTGGPNSTQYSYDGINWTAGQNIFSTGGDGIAWNGSIWIAVGQSSSSIYVSYNGISWQASTNDPFGGITHGIAWNGSLWVAVGEGSASIAWSSDGITWTPISNSTTLYFSGGEGIAWNGSQFVAVGGGIAVGRIAYSPDGKNWTAATSNPFSVLGFGVTWNGYKWFAVGGTTPIMASSIDGNTWTTVSCGALNIDGVSIASRRVLPYVGQTVVPPVFHQNEITTSTGALVFTSPTGTNNLYYSRFLNSTENGDGTGVLKVNGTMDVSSVINSNGPLLLGPASKSDCLFLNTNPSTAGGYISIGGAGAGTVNIAGGNPSAPNYNGVIQMSGDPVNNPTLTIGANGTNYNNIIVGPGLQTTINGNFLISNALYWQYAVNRAYNQAPAPNWVNGSSVYWDTTVNEPSTYINKLTNNTTWTAPIDGVYSIQSSITINVNNANSTDSIACIIYYNRGISGNAYVGTFSIAKNSIGINGWAFGNTNLFYQMYLNQNDTIEITCVGIQNAFSYYGIAPGQSTVNPTTLTITLIQTGAES